VGTEQLTGNFRAAVPVIPKSNFTKSTGGSLHFPASVEGLSSFARLDGRRRPSLHNLYRRPKTPMPLVVPT
jgi:hypothetical protein